MLNVNCRRDDRWLSLALEALRYDGYCVVEGVLQESLLGPLRNGMYGARESIHREVSMEKLRRAGEVGVLRILLKFDPIFFRLLEIPELLDVVDATVSATAILHLQNGFILPSYPPDATPGVFQNSFHRDFPRYLNGYVASVNALFAIDPFSASNGATLVVPGSHQRAEPPTPEYLAKATVPAECPAGSMVLFDSTLWHAAGHNTSGKDRLAINQQFTRSWIKQQIDYVRALGIEAVEQQSERTRKLLGYHSRVVTNLGEYYRPEDERLYRRGQG